MKADEWQQINDLFHAALEREPDERAAFLAHACAGDEGLRLEVESLLASHDPSDSFIASLAPDLAAGLLAEGQARLATGQSVGNYRVMALLGTGGMGEVYLTEDTRLGRRVALKLLPVQFTREPDRLHRFEREARAASSLNHPNIITIHEVGQVEGQPFIITEFIEGKTLRQQTAAAKMTLREALDVATQVASALEAAHKAGIVHRDIKPENIMLRPDGLVKVLDFGLAKLTEAQPPGPGAQATTLASVQTKIGLVMGTVTYMSPEQARGLAVDARSDIFSLGTLIYEMIAGKVPFDGATTSDVIVSILEREPVPLSLYAPGAPAELERIVRKSLARDREERYQLARDLLIDLRNLKQEMELQAKLDAVRPAELKGATPAGLRVSIDTDEQLTPRSTDAEVALTVPSAAHLVGKIKTHKRAVALGLAALLIAAAAIIYFTYLTRSGDAIDSIAVMPFVNVGNDPNVEYLSDGISDSIIDSLSQLSNLKRVISFSSVLRYKGKQMEPQAVGRELNVRAVLMGRLTLRGDELLISTELVDVKDDRRLWGGQYKRKQADVLALQGEIAQEISEGLRLRLSGEEKQRLAKRSTDNPEAYQLYLLGRFYRRNRAGNQKAIDYLEQAIKKDPNYAPAYAQLAYTYASAGAGDWFPRKEARERVEGAVQRALELDETLGDAHAALAITADDWSVKTREFQRALELDPNSADVHAFYARVLWGRRRIDEAILHMKRAVELDPLSPALQTDLGKTLYSAGQRDQAMAQYRKALELNPNYAGAHHHLANFYLAEGRYQEAIAEAEKMSANTPPEGGQGRPFLGYTYAVAGKRAEAEKILHELKELSKQRHVNPEAFALIYTGLGDKDRAFEFLQKEYEENKRLPTFINILPEWDSLRTDPRFVELIRRSESRLE
jgi:serine/threonine protein kinase/Tfp pilus assembly protein PilF